MLINICGYDTTGTICLEKIWWMSQTNDESTVT